LRGSSPSPRCWQRPHSPPLRSYWLGRQPDPKLDEFVFDVPVSADLAAKLTCAGAKGAKYKSGVREFRWETGGKSYTFVQNAIAWDGDQIDAGSFAYFRNNAVEKDAWVSVDPRAAGFKAVRDVFVAQKKMWADGWFEVTPILLRADGKENPKLTVNFNTDAPFNVRTHPPEFDVAIGSQAPTKKPQIVGTVQGDSLFIAYQTWERAKPTDKVVIAKVPVADVAKQKLSLVRVVSSGGTLVGFTVDAKGRDYVLTAKAEEFPNNPKGDFVDEVAKTWRKEVIFLHSAGTATDLNTEKFTAETVYGVGNGGSGRLAVGAGHLATVFARRHYTPSDKLIHQEADVALFSADLSRVPVKAHNAASHSFDQRLIFDGTDFVALHQGDQYPITGLLIEKVLVAGKGRPARYAAFSCPTFGNNVFFELGGLAAEPDGYPILFTATRNTEEVPPKAVEEKTKRPWDLAMVYVRRDFHTKVAPKNPFDIVGSGILAGGYAKPETVTFDNLSWDPAASMFSKRESRTVTRQVSWLTDYSTVNALTRASAAKLVQLEVGKYLAVWEEQGSAGRGWEHRRTMAATITIKGSKNDKSIEAGKPVALTGNPRLHRGDDAFALPQGGKKVAAWLTAGETNKQLTLHTVNDELKHEAIPLNLP
jgi:hypothetical protein